MSLFESVVDKAKQVKSEYDQHKRAQREDILNVKDNVLREKAAELKATEDKLQKLTIDLVRREALIEKRERRPRLVFLLCVLAGALIFKYGSDNYEFVRRSESQPTSAFDSNSAAQSADISSSDSVVNDTGISPLTDRESKVYDTYNE